MELDIGRQYNWLKSDLEKASNNRHKTPWIIVYGHRPFYCSDDTFLKEQKLTRKLKSEKDCIKNADRLKNGIYILGQRKYGLESLFRDYGVDLYLCGHEHSYERLFPVYQEQVYNGSYHQPYVNPQAPVHIITGSAGNKEKLDLFGPPRGPWSAFRSSTYGYSRMNVYNNTHLYMEQVLESDSSIIDSIWLIQEKHGPFTNLQKIYT